MFHHRIRGDQQHFVRRDELKVDICIYSIECDIYNYEHCLLIYIVASYVWNIILQMDMMIDYVINVDDVHGAGGMGDIHPAIAQDR